MKQLVEILQGRYIAYTTHEKLSLEELIEHFELGSDVQTVFHEDRHWIILREVYLEEFPEQNDNGVCFFEIVLNHNPETLEMEIETVRWILDNEELREGDIEEFLDDLKDLPQSYLIVGYDSAKNDCYPIVSLLIDELTNIVATGSSFLSISWEMCTFIDLRSFLPYDLETAIDIWNISSKQKVEQIRDLYRLLEKNIKDVCGFDLKGGNFVTLSQLAWEYFKGLTNRQWLKPCLDGYDFIRSAMIGGRTQAFVREEITEPVRLIDANSLYPYTYLREFPVGKTMWVTEEVPDLLGVYEVEILSQPPIAIVPHREKSLNWNPTHPFVSCVSSVHLNLLKEYGGTYRVMKGLVWEGKAKVFEPYLSLYERKKQSVKGSGEYNLYKLLLNTLSGKVAQKDPTTKIKLVRSDVENKNLLPYFGLNQAIQQQKVEKIHSGRSKPCHLAVFIYAYGQEHMYRTILTQYDHPLYIDTDGVIVYRKEYEKDLLERPELYGDELGQFKEELGATGDSGAIILQPKRYWVEGHARFSGVPLNCLWYLDGQEMGTELGREFYSAILLGMNPYVKLTRQQRSITLLEIDQKEYFFSL